MCSRLLGSAQELKQIMLPPSEPGDFLVAITQFLFPLQAKCFEVLPQLIHLLMRPIFHRADMRLRCRMFSPERINLGLPVIELNLKMIALALKVSDLSEQLIDHYLAFEQLRFGLGVLRGGLSCVRLRLGECVLPNFPLLGQ